MSTNLSPDKVHTRDEKSVARSLNNQRRSDSHTSQQAASRKNIPTNREDLEKQARENVKKADDLYRKGQESKQQADKIMAQRRATNMTENEAKEKDDKNFNGEKRNQKYREEALEKKKQEMQEKGQTDDEWNRSKEQEEQQLREESDRSKKEAQQIQQEQKETARQFRESQDAADNKNQAASENDNKKTTEDAAPGQDGQQPEVTPDGAATGDNPLDATKQGRGGTALGENPAQMGTESNMDSDHNKDIGEALKEREEKEHEELMQRTPGLRPANKQSNLGDANKYKSPGTSSPSDLANDMSGGENTPKPNAMEGDKKGQGKDFQPGGGQVSPPEGEPKKSGTPEAEGGGGTMQKAGDMAKGAMDKGRQAADAVKEKVDAVKNAAQNVKDKLGAPGRKLTEAKEAISNFMDDMNPIKKLKKLFKSVSVPQLVGGLVRIYLMSQGLGTFTSMLDKMIKEENANRLYTCCCCSSCCCACLSPFLPLIIVVLAIAA